MACVLPYPTLPYRISYLSYPTLPYPTQHYPLPTTQLLSSPTTAYLTLSLTNIRRLSDRSFGLIADTRSSRLILDTRSFSPPPPPRRFSFFLFFFIILFAAPRVPPLFFLFSLFAPVSSLPAFSVHFFPSRDARSSPRCNFIPQTSAAARRVSFSTRIRSRLFYSVRYVRYYNRE